MSPFQLAYTAVESPVVRILALTAGAVAMAHPGEAEDPVGGHFRGHVRVEENFAVWVSQLVHHPTR